MSNQAIQTTPNNSYKSTDKSDYKFWVLVGKRKLHYDILDAWGEKTTSKNMWEHAYHINKKYPTATIKHCMEDNFIQEEVHSRLRRLSHSVAVNRPEVLAHSCAFVG